MENRAQAFAASQGAESAATRGPINDNQEEEGTSIPQLPAPSGEDEGESNIPVIQLGETIQLKEMGPIILNTDGSTRRIQNWDSMTAREQEVTWRRISKRNEERRKKLLLQQQEASESAVKTDAKEIDNEL